LGLDLLLSGRSIDPATAIAAGLFDAIPTAQSPQDAARQRVVAINAHSSAQVPAPEQEKFAFAPLDLPPDQDAEVRALAAATGITESALRDYPAYRAIIRSVLSGGRHAMAKATDIEMRCFLDLMFNPVAANMVSTLFLERQRVEKNMASLATQLPESIKLGPLTSAVKPWRDALLPTGLRIVNDESLGMNLVEFTTSDGPPSQWRLSSASDGLADTRESNAAAVAGLTMPMLVLSERSEHGRVIELIGNTAPGIIAALARKMRCLLMLTPDGASLLQELTRAKLDASASAASETEVIAEAARRAMTAGRVIDPAALDVAAVLAGISPAYTGGPLRLARQSA
jgi:3-hydroxyacyl-CoA dehydrogenase / enoyl-CoA hydratase / 3-hydroxybutyryl-CoA epimerase